MVYCILKDKSLEKFLRQDIFLKYATFRLLETVATDREKRRQEFLRLNGTFYKTI